MEQLCSSLTGDQEDHENSTENSQDAGMCNDTKTTTTTTSSPKTSRRSMKKRVVSVPIRETNAPPSDSWTWRKYGQKPIKGSPYPRGYYRCSSSKGCPARKQVERSRADPTMVMVTYSCDHNHPWPPASRSNHQPHNSTASPPPASTSTTTDDQEEDPPLVTQQSIAESDGKFSSHEVIPVAPFVTTIDQFGWFSDLESMSSTMLESPLMAGYTDADMPMVFSVREEDESLFADLGELPECVTVFRRRNVITEEEHHRRPCNLAPWCGTKG